MQQLCCCLPQPDSCDTDDVCNKCMCSYYSHPASLQRHTKCCASPHLTTALPCTKNGCKYFKITHQHIPLQGGLQNIHRYRHPPASATRQQQQHQPLLQASAPGHGRHPAQKNNSSASHQKQLREHQPPSSSELIAAHQPLGPPPAAVTGVALSPWASTAPCSATAASSAWAASCRSYQHPAPASPAAPAGHRLPPLLHAPAPLLPVWSAGC